METRMIPRLRIDVMTYPWTAILHEPTQYPFLDWSLLVAARLWKPLTTDKKVTVLKEQEPAPCENNIRTQLCYKDW